jgi:signal transduction histidine kinase
MNTKAQIVASLESAKGDLELALANLEKLPSLDWGAVRYAAHSLGNYLNVTSACVELLKMSLEPHPDPEVRVWLEGLERVTELMTHVARQMTNASAASEVPLEADSVDLSRMAERAAAFYQSMADRKRLEVVADVPPAATYVQADRIALGAVLDNLLSNAVKFSPPGKRVWVRVRDEADRAVLTVEDEGPGLTPEDRAKLFQRGVRLTARPTGSEPSTGYGLAIARDLTTRMGGSLECESTPGKGARFSVTLPAYARAQHDAPTSGAERS